jgi:hypothetical protein
MTFYEFIIQNWSQLIILLGALGYILKTTFDFLLKKKEIKFIKLHELRAVKISAIFQSLAEMEHSFDRYLSQVHDLASLEAEKKLLCTARASVNGFKKMIHINELYFDKSTNEKLKNISKSYSEALLNSYTIFEGDEESEEIWRGKGKRTLDSLNKKVSPVKRELKNQFQTFIGI